MARYYKSGLPSTHLKFGQLLPLLLITCSDPIGIVAVGDAWLNKYCQDKVGSSLFVAKKIVDEMKDKNIIYAEKETQENILISQSINHIKFKTSNILQRDVSFGTKRENEKATSSINKYIYGKKNIVIKFYGKL